MVRFRIGGEEENQQKEESRHEGGVEVDIRRFGFVVPLCDGDIGGGEAGEVSGCGGRGDEGGAV